MHSPKKQKILTEQEALQKIMAYCSYQERSSGEVLKKLYAYGLEKDAAERMLEHLMSENFLNESRFVQAYVGGKFRLQKWGKVKVEQALRTHQLSDEQIDGALDLIGDEEYRQTLQLLLEKKNTQIKEENPFKRRDKLYRFGLQKGYESELILSVLAKVLPEITP